MKITNECSDKELDKLYQKLFGLLAEAKIDEVNTLLQTTVVDETPLTLLIGYLVITSHYKSKLPARKSFYNRVVESTSRHGLNEKGLFDNLGNDDDREKMPEVRVIERMLGVHPSLIE